MKVLTLICLATASVCFAAPDGHMKKKMMMMMGGQCGVKAKLMKMMRDPMMMAQKKKEMLSTLAFMESYPASGPSDTCSDVPETLMMGPPKSCNAKGEESCICVKIPEPEVLDSLMEMGAVIPEQVNTDTGFIRKCGMCHDPCELKWMPMPMQLDFEEEMALNMIFMGGVVKKMAKKVKMMKAKAEHMGMDVDMKEGLMEFMMNAMEMEGGGDAKYMLKKLLGKKKDAMEMMNEIPREVKALLKVAMDIMRESSDDSSEEEDMDSMEDDYSMEGKCSMEEEE